MYLPHLDRRECTRPSKGGCQYNAGSKTMLIPVQRLVDVLDVLASEYIYQLDVAGVAIYHPHVQRLAAQIASIVEELSSRGVEVWCHFEPTPRFSVTVK